MTISSHRVGVYNDELVDIAQGAADLVSAYLFALERGKIARNPAVAESEARNAEEALRLEAQRLTEGMERERKRLGIDLHDQTLAELARLTRRGAQSRLQHLYIKLGLAKHDIPVGDWGPSYNTLTRAVAIALSRGFLNADALRREEDSMRIWLQRCEETEPLSPHSARSPFPCLALEGLSR
ncbi:MAG: hypothetical protein AAGD34_08690 [Pseudomonadota bacterium]